jgi:hypothetical protein
MVAPLMDPFEGDSLRVVGVAQEAALGLTREFLLATGAHALLLVGAYGEPYADPVNRPRIVHGLFAAAEVVARIRRTHREFAAWNPRHTFGRGCGRAQAGSINDRWQVGVSDGLRGRNNGGWRHAGTSEHRGRWTRESERSGAEDGEPRNRGDQTRGKWVHPGRRSTKGRRAGV